eukprot:3750748-Pleurochrysis_carterae.AAC.1
MTRTEDEDDSSDDSRRDNSRDNSSDDSSRSDSSNSDQSLSSSPEKKERARLAAKGSELARGGDQSLGRG